MILSNDEFRELYDVHYSLVLNFVRGGVNNAPDVEEIVQDVFVRVARNYGNFRGQSQLRTWILTIARHAIVDFWRKQGKAVQRVQLISMDEGLSQLESQEGDPLEAAIRQSEGEAVRQCIQRLPEKMRLILLCRIYQGLSVAETAQILGWTEPRVRVTQSRAMRKFSMEWQDSGWAVSVTY